MTSTLARPEPHIERATHIESRETSGFAEQIPYRFTSDQLLKMGEHNIFHPDDRIELIEGEVFSMVPPGSIHNARQIGVTRAFNRVFGDEQIVVSSVSFRLDDGTLLEPDMMILRYQDDFYADKVPGPEDTLLVIEVSFSTLRLDRTRKLDLYARAGVPEYWILNAIDTVIETHSVPINGRYTQSHIYHPGETISPAAFPELAFNVSEIMVPPSERPA